MSATTEKLRRRDYFLRTIETFSRTQTHQSQLTFNSVVSLPADVNLDFQVSVQSSELMKSRSKQLKGLLCFLKEDVSVWLTDSFNHSRPTADTMRRLHIRDPGRILSTLEPKVQFV